MYEPGDEVRVIEGAFANFSGMVEEVKPEKLKLKVKVSIFGRATPVELDFSQVREAQLGDRDDRETMASGAGPTGPRPAALPPGRCGETRAGAPTRQEASGDPRGVTEASRAKGPAAGEGWRNNHCDHHGAPTRVTPRGSTRKRR